MKTLAAIAVFIVWSLAGCDAAIPDGRYACSTNADCPPDFSCRSDNLCYRGLDGGAPDTSTGDASTDGAPDGDVDAGCVDFDEDLYCAGDPGQAGVDCDDEARDVNPGSDEACEGDAEGRDDDCDGEVDEACPFSLGLVHSPVRLHAPAETPMAAPTGSFFGPELSPNGLTLYFAHYSDFGAPLFSAERASLADEFGDPAAIPGTSDPRLRHTVLSVTGDALEVFVQAEAMGEGVHIWHATRAERLDSFGPFALVTATVDADPTSSQIHPSISRDGLELFYVQDDSGVTELRHVRRSSRGEQFQMPETIVSADNPRFPRLWEDGRTLVYSSDLEPRVRMRVRAEQEGEFGDAEPFPHVPDSHMGALFYFSAAAREMWFTAEGPDPAAPMSNAMFRAQVCRQSICATPAPVVCDSGVRTTDGLRCFAGDDNGTAADRGTRCAALGMNPASVHTADDASALEADGLAGWLGLERSTTSTSFAWDDGSPLLDQRWIPPSEPSSGPSDLCAFTNRMGRWDAVPCENRYLRLCVRELWPVFVP